MRRGLLLAPILISIAMSAQAADATYFKFSDLLEANSDDEPLDPPVTLYWGAKPAPEFPEMARPDSYTRSSISLSPFGGSKRHCVEAFQKSLAAMIGDAQARGYDAIVDIRSVGDGKFSNDSAGFNCKPGYKTTEVSLMGTFAMTPAAVQRMAAAEERSTHLPARPPSKGAIFLPLGPILNSPEARAVLGQKIAAYGGIEAPPYSQRFGPDVYSDDADIGKLGNEEACKQAVLKTLGAMVQESTTRNFDSIIKIRSFLDEQFAPAATDLECQVGKKSASVTLQSSLASRK